MIKHGQAEVILAGGAEALVTFAGVTALTKLGVLSGQTDPAIACRPFDLDRDGLVLGEAAGVLVVESLDSARQRGAPILAEIAGFGSSGNAFRITDSPSDGLGASFAITRCLAEAGIKPEEISAISAHATSTKQNDLSETNAIKRALGETATRIPVFALKSVLGHSLSAAGAVELVAGVNTVQTGYIPHIRSYHTPDSDCDLNVVTSPVQAASFKYLLKNSFGFGGQNGSLLLKAWPV
jgi:3-oxoacyl-[acyl-carrier-protein] synthase II